MVRTAPIRAIRAICVRTPHKKRANTRFAPTRHTDGCLLMAEITSDACPRPKDGINGQWLIVNCYAWYTPNHVSGITINHWQLTINLSFRAKRRISFRHFWLDPKVTKRSRLRALHTPLQRSQIWKSGNSLRSDSLIFYRPARCSVGSPPEAHGRTPKWMVNG